MEGLGGTLLRMACQLAISEHIVMTYTHTKLECCATIETDIDNIVFSQKFTDGTLQFSWVKWLLVNILLLP